jgi:hypothetical protein
MRLVRLAGLLFVAVVAVCCVVMGSAFADPGNPLFRPASGQTVTGTSTAESALVSGALEARCKENKVVSGNVVNSLLIGNIVIHYLGCTWTKGEQTSGCEANSVGESGGLILTNTLHAILGIILPSGETGALFLPQKGTSFVSFAEATKGELKCAEDSTVSGNVVGLVAPFGSKQLTGKVIVGLAGAVQAVKDFDLTHGLGLVVPRLVMFSQTAALDQSDAVTFGVATEVT